MDDMAPAANYDGPDENLLTAEMDGRVQAELTHGERLIWTGRPRSVPGGCSINAVLILGVIPFAAGAALLTWAIMGKQPADVLLAIGLGLTVFGFIFTTLGFFAVRYGRWKARQMCYALTDQRAIVWIPEMGGRIMVRSFRPNEIRTLYRREAPDGSGDLILMDVQVQGTGQQPTTLQPQGFFNVPEVRKMEELVRATLLGKNEQ